MYVLYISLFLKVKSDYYFIDMLYCLFLLVVIIIVFGLFFLQGNLWKELLDILKMVVFYFFYFDIFFFCFVSFVWIVYDSFWFVEVMMIKKDFLGRILDFIFDLFIILVIGWCVILENIVEYGKENKVVFFVVIVDLFVWRKFYFLQVYVCQCCNV